MSFIKKKANIFLALFENQYLCSPKRNNFISINIIKNNKTMTKAEIVDKISQKTGIAKKDVLASVESFMEEVRNSLISREEVYLRGFGSFIVKHRAQKTARNISKNTTIVVDAHDFPSFKPSKSFVEKMK